MKMLIIESLLIGFVILMIYWALRLWFRGLQADRALKDDKPYVPSYVVKEGKRSVVLCWNCDHVMSAKPGSTCINCGWKSPK